MSKKVLPKEFTAFPEPMILSTARDFAAASRILRSQSGVSVPVIINAVLSLELYLKSLHATQIYNGDENLSISRISKLRSNTHSVHELFQNLPRDKQEWLTSLYRIFFGDRVGSSLAEDLKSFDGVFINWRYIYEGKAKTVQSGLLDELINFFEFSCSPASTAKFQE
ncbi:hypothetical protein [Herminiimonas contaminans]|uniref:Uncharacterized protein n=1 Tax=Herminiimonas contaminans TaxID=1111140 RepID=A0ABS0EYA3_9BURK|nr:hypothetical protein [Herminiimonas contaminans]MBF8179765.1 hypothetical protein [Herminiimonas contaminans]